MFTQECKLLWLDLETTGLNPGVDHILEVAVVATDWRFDDVQPLYDSPVGTGVDHLVMMSDYARKIHTENGLLDEIKRGHGQDLRVLEQDLVNVVYKHYTSQGFKPLLAGSSVHFDKRFLAEWMPELHNCLHYRIFDVSTLKAYREAASGREFTSSDAHRAMDDILASIDAARDFSRVFTDTGYNAGYRDAMKWMTKIGTLTLEKGPKECEEAVRAHFESRGLGDLLVGKDGQ